MEEPNDRMTPDPQPSEKKPDPTLFYWIRAFVGGYLVYLAWQLFADIRAGTASGTSLIVSGIAAAVFALAGLGLVGWSLWLLFGKK